MLNSLDFLKNDYSMIFDLMHPELIWMISTSRLLPFNIMAILIVFLILYFITKKFIIKKSFIIKNYLIIFFSSLIIYYILWVILLTLFAIALGGLSQYI